MKVHLRFQPSPMLMVVGDGPLGQWRGRRRVATRATGFPSARARARSCLFLPHHEVPCRTPAHVCHTNTRVPHASTRVPHAYMPHEARGRGGVALCRAPALFAPPALCRKHADVPFPLAAQCCADAAIRPTRAAGSVSALFALRGSNEPERAKCQSLHGNLQFVGGGVAVLTSRALHSAQHTIPARFPRDHTSATHACKGGSGHPPAHMLIGVKTEPPRG
jgi:hypothetical protein